MLLTTTENVHGRTLAYLGLVSTEVIKPLTEDARCGPAGPVAEIVAATRTESLEQLERKARSLGADAVIGVSLTTGMLTANLIIVTAVGTAVRFLGPRPRS